MHRFYVRTAFIIAVFAHTLLSTGCVVVEHPSTQSPVPVAASKLAFGYIESTQAGTVSQFQISPEGLWTSLAPAELPSGRYPESLAVDPSGRFVYVANADDNTVSEYTISASTGTLTPDEPATIGTGSFPPWLVSDPLGKFICVANTNESTISEYSIDQTTGKLTQIAKLPFTTSSGRGFPVGIIVDPLDRFVYIVGGSTIDVFTIDAATGFIKTGLPQSVTVGSGNFPPAIDPSGTFLYLPSSGLNAVEVAAIDPVSGALTPAAIPSVPVGSGASSGALDPTGEFLYVVNRGSQSISQSNVGLGGSLMPMSVPVLQDLGEPWQILVDPSGQRA
jgi:6-phosphogluconolactonase